ncbi:transglycosylase SLT domain-containing protein [Vreelandella utahensis]|uniref:transglycosylase SLT domain-containing protein n=1 Tax=Vreelandella halophila TaxID=86177 RepID=UPI000986607B|nr:transglycosylase SLT domain-containing protein [Halomonas utahensis]
MRRLIVTLASAVALTGAPVAQAVLEVPGLSGTPTVPVVRSTDANESLERQRERFLKAEDALEKLDIDTYESLSEGLENYPLHPYLELKHLSKRLFVATPAEIETMMAEYGDIPLARALRRQWLIHLGRSGQWSTLRQVHDGTSGGDRLRCLSLRAHLKDGRHSLVMNQVPDLWQKGYSLPQACNPLLDYWRENGGLTRELAWTRFHLSVTNGNLGLARYLRRYLDQDDRPLSRLLLSVHSQPERLRKARDFDRNDERVGQIVAYGMQRLVNQDPERAAAIWPFYRGRFPYESGAVAAIDKRLGLLLATRFHPEAATWLARALSHGEDEALREWQVRVALRAQNWPKVLERISAMGRELQEKPRWQYWQARALDQMDRPAEAQALYETLSDRRTFYGFMAADQLGKPYSLNHQGVAMNDEAIERVRATPGVQRALELYRLDRLDAARAEWRQAMGKLEKRDVLVASRIAQGWGWHEQGVHGAIAVSAWDHLGMRFPLAHRQSFHGAAREYSLDVNWVYALARQESAFQPDARSHRGAFGLLQLLPATARETAQEAGLSFNGIATLLDPAANIRLGSAHLSGLLQRFDNNRILATAAYNAGEYRVSQWIDEDTRDLASDIWVETMPYHETRQYVRNVMAYTVIYGYRRGEPPGHLLTERELACMCLDEVQ